jgi:hypothetical protein
MKKFVQSVSYWVLCGVLFGGIVKVSGGSNKLHAFSHSLDIHGDDAAIHREAERAMKREAQERKDRAEAKERKEREAREKRAKEEREQKRQAEEKRRKDEERRAFQENKRAEARRAEERMKKQLEDGKKQFKGK